MTNHPSKTKQIAAAVLALLCLSGCTSSEKAEAINAFVKECQQKGGTAHIEGSVNNLDYILPNYVNFSCSLPSSSESGAKK